jgi:hypothetical protein
MSAEDHLIEYLSYNTETGELTWAKSPSPRIKVGAKAGSVGKKGYVVLGLKNRHYKAHRVVWLLVNKSWPKMSLDHINGVKTDNRIENLREATVTLNLANREKQKDTSSRFKGVHWVKAEKKWKAGIRVEGKKRHLGYFSCEESAAKAYDAEAKKLYGDFAKLNFKGENL